VQAGNHIRVTDSDNNQGPTVNHPSRVCVRILAGLAISFPLYATQYSIQVLPAPLIHPVGINAKGEIVGDGVLYDGRDNSFTRLHCSGPNCSVKENAINDYSLVAGSISFDDPSSPGGVALKPAYWQAKLSPQPKLLPSEPGTLTFIAGISNTNDFAGRFDTRQITDGMWWYVPDLSQGWMTESFFYGFAFCYVPLPHPSNVATAVNDAHHVAGAADWNQLLGSGNCLGGSHPFIAIDGRPNDLLAGVPNTIYYATASSINNSDDVVGDAAAPGDLTGQGPYTAVLYRGGGVTNLGTLQNQPNQNSSAVAINDYSEIVGWSDVLAPGNPYPITVQRAFVSTGVGMSDLASLINPRSGLAGKVVLTRANAINCNGWIVADGYDIATSTAHAYLLKPQPQPVRPDCLAKLAYPDQAPAFPIPPPP
jgi:hypothetical protein